ncbi:MAG: hypothetical protein JRI44_13610, partial [Deltaproteobacteria bacterium]|nr:hypothetical protein [Deltaproteobacteria bacterium]
DFIKDANLQGIDVQIEGMKDWISPENLKYIKARDIMKGVGSSQTSQAMGQAIWQQEGLGELPQLPQQPKMSDYTNAIKYLSNFTNKQAFESQKPMLEKRFGIDLSGVTFESLQNQGGSRMINTYYSSPEEALENTPDLPGLTKEPVQMKEGWKVDYQKESEIAEKPRVTSLPQLEEYSEKLLYSSSPQEYKSLKDMYAKAGYDTSQLPPETQVVENQQTELNGLYEQIKTLLGEDKKLNKPDEEIRLNIDGKTQTVTKKEAYQMIKEQIDAYKESLQNWGIDTSKYPELKPADKLSSWWGLIKSEAY